MAAVSAYCAKAMLDWMTGAATVTRPSSRFLGLSLGTPTSISASEASFSGYARRAVVYSAAVSPAGSAVNSGAVTHSALTAAGTVRGWQLWDATTSGNMLAYGLLSGASTMSSGDTMSFAAGSILITLA